MKIALVAHNLRLSGGKSVGQNIISTMPQIAPMHDYFMIVPQEAGYPVFKGKKNIAVLECPQVGLARRWWWENQVMRPAIKDFNPEWVWALGNYGILVKGLSQSLLIHDAHLVYPQKYFHFESFIYKLKKRILSFLAKKTSKNAKFVYAQTDVMANHIHSKFGISKSKIRICQNAISDPVINNKDNRIDNLFKVFKDKFKLFLLSSCSGHKNFEGIISMFSKYRCELSNVVCFFTFSENQNKRSKKITQAIYDYNLNEHIVNLGPIDQKKLSNYFSEIDALFFPSLLESFSSTYLEAMYFGVPIITSDLDFAHAICGNAACYVNPNNIDSMFDGINRLMNSRRYIGELVNLGSVQRKKFSASWEDILTQVLDAEGIEHI